MSRTENVSKNALFGTINTFITLFVPFILKTLLLNVLGSKYLGINNLFHSIISILNLVDLGFGSAIVFAMYEPIANKDDEKLCSLLLFYKKIYIFLGVIILLMGVAVIPFLNLLVNNDCPKDINLTVIYLVYLLEVVISYLFFAEKEALLIALEKSNIIHISSIIINVFFYAIRALVLIVFKNYYLFIIFLPIVSFFNKLSISIVCNRKFNQYSCKGIINENFRKEIIKNTIAVSYNKIGEVVDSSIGNVLISSMYGLSSVAIYGNYNYVITSLISLNSALLLSTQASLGNSIVLESKSKNIENFNIISLINSWINCWSVTCTYCLYQNFILLFFGENMVANRIIPLLFAIYLYIKQSRKSIDLFRLSAGLWKEDKYRPVIASVVNILLSYLLVKKYGMGGCILSLIITNVFIHMPWENRTLFNKYFGIKQNDYIFEMYKNIFVIVLSVLISIYICGRIPNVGLLNLIINGFVSFLVSNILFLFINWNKIVEFDILTKIKKLIFSIR